METKMTVAMRVINLMSAHKAGSPEDVALLRFWAAPEDRNLAPDELACLVIEADLLSRRNARAKNSGNSQAQAAKA